MFVVHLLSRVWLFATPWTAAHQTSLSFPISQSLLKLISIEYMNWATFYLLALVVNLRIVMVLVGVLFNLLMYCSESTMRFKVYWKLNRLAILYLIASNQFFPCSQWLCHSFEGCALSPSLLSQFQGIVEISTARVGWVMRRVEEMRL